MVSRLATDIAYVTKLIESRKDIHNMYNTISIYFTHHGITLTYLVSVKKMMDSNEAASEINRQIQELKDQNRVTCILMRNDETHKTITFYEKMYDLMFDSASSDLSTTESYSYPDSIEGKRAAILKLLTFLSRIPDNRKEIYLLYDDIKRYVNTNISRLIMNFYT